MSASFGSLTLQFGFGSLAPLVTFLPSGLVRSPVDDLSRLDRKESCRIDSLFFACAKEVERRLVRLFIGEIESLPVHAQAELRTDVFVDANGIERVDVDGRHEAAWQIGPDRDEA